MPWPAIAQSFITIGALVLLWSLHSRLADRPVFRWWAWAWTSYGLNLGAATLAGRLGLDWSVPRATLVLLTAIFGFLTSLFLIFGARSMVSIDLPTRFQRRAGTVLAVGAAVVTVLVSLAWSQRTSAITRASRHGHLRSRLRSSTARGSSSLCGRGTARPRA